MQTRHQGGQHQNIIAIDLSKIFFVHLDAMLILFLLIDIYPMLLLIILVSFFLCITLLFSNFSLVILAIMNSSACHARLGRELARRSQTLCQLGRAPLCDLWVRLNLLLQLEQAWGFLGAQQRGTCREPLDNAQHGVCAEVGQSDLIKKMRQEKKGEREVISAVQRRDGYISPTIPSVYL